jgi:hypothetical protein
LLRRPSCATAPCSLPCNAWPDCLQAALKKWEAEEASKRALQHSIMERLKEDRAQQLSERAMRKLMVG